MKVIRSILLPFKNTKLLLPDTVIAEIININNFSQKKTQKPWILGEISWRDIDLPLISLELFDEQYSFTIKNNFTIAIFNIVINKKDQKFFAVALQGYPKIIKVTENDLIYQGENNRSIFKYKAALRGNSVSMLEIEDFQKKILSNF